MRGMKRKSVKVAVVVRSMRRSIATTAGVLMGMKGIMGAITPLASLSVGPGSGPAVPGVASGGLVLGCISDGISQPGRNGSPAWSNI